MKKSLLALSAAAIALSGMAAAPKDMQKASPLQFDKKRQVEASSHLRLGSAPSRMLKAPAKVGTAADVITEAEGTRQDMTLNGSGYYVYYYWVMQYADEVGANHVVYGDNDEVYIYDIMLMAPTGSYVKGVKKNDKVEVSLPQTIAFDEDYGYGYNLCLLEQIQIEEDGEIYYDFVPTEAESVTFSVAEDGTMVAEGLSDELILGLAYTDDDTWGGYGVSELSLTPFYGKAVELPEDYEVSEEFWSCIGNGYGWSVNWAQGGEEVYFQGLSEGMPDSWFMGKIEYGDDEAIISVPQNQYIGVAAACYIYTKAAQILYNEEEDYEYYELMPDDYEYQMVWNYEDMTITAKDPNVSLLFNAKLDDIYYYNEFYDLKLIHQDSFAGTPQNPTNLDFDADWGELVFNVPALSTDDEVLKIKDLYYVIYVDGEEWEFSPEDYDIEEEMTEIPWSFDCSDIMNFGGTLRVIEFYVEPTSITTIGVQSIYKYDGEETRSEIVTLDLEADPDAVGTVNAGKKVSSVKYYGLDGREVANPAAGIFVKRVIFEDGSVANFKKAIR